MKKEMPTGLVIAAVVVLLAVVAFVFIKQSGAPSDKVDVRKLDPKDLKDEDPVRRGQPGYQERISDPPVGQPQSGR